MSTIFRKKAIKRLSSPEQLDQLIKVTGSKAWLILAVFIVLLSLAIIWGFMAKLPVKVVGKGVIIHENAIKNIVKEVLEVEVFIPAIKGADIEPGMVAEVELLTVSKEKHGFIWGQVSSVARYPITHKEALAIFRDEDLVRKIFKKGPVLGAKIKLKANKKNYSGYQWSLGSGPKISIHNGTICTARIVTSYETPASLVIPIFRESLGN
jgi:hypothetical protein